MEIEYEYAVTGNHPVTLEPSVRFSPTMEEAEMVAGAWARNYEQINVRVLRRPKPAPWEEAT